MHCIYNKGSWQASLLAISHPAQLWSTPCSEYSMPQGVVWTVKVAMYAAVGCAQALLRPFKLFLHASEVWLCSRALQSEAG